MPRAMNKGSEAKTSRNLNAPESGSEGPSQNTTGQVTKVSAAIFHFTATFTRHLTLELSGARLFARPLGRRVRPARRAARRGLLYLVGTSTFWKNCGWKVRNPVLCLTATSLQEPLLTAEAAVARNDCADFCERYSARRPKACLDKTEPIRFESVWSRR